MSFVRKAVETVVKFVGSDQRPKPYSKLFERNKGFINYGITKKGIKFGVINTCSSIIRGMVTDYVYAHVEEWVQQSDKFITKPASDIFITWASKLSKPEEYGTAKSIDFMVPEINLHIDEKIMKKLSEAVDKYLKDMTIEAFGTLLNAICLGIHNDMITIGYKMFDDKRNPGSKYPNDFIQWIMHSDRGKRYFRLNSIDDKLTFGYILEQSVQYYL